MGSPNTPPPQKKMLQSCIPERPAAEATWRCLVCLCWRILKPGVGICKIQLKMNAMIQNLGQLVGEPVGY